MSVIRWYLWSGVLTWTALSLIVLYHGDIVAFFLYFAGVVTFGVIATRFARHEPPEA